MVILDKINYQFTYTNSSTERLKLKTLTKTTPSGTQSTYSLNYFPNHLPGYNTGHYDNLGFNNGENFSYYFSKEFFENAIFADKQIAEGKEYTNKRMGDKGGFRVTAEMLKSITYPTHGRTEFIYEPTSYPVWCQQTGKQYKVPIYLIQALQIIHIREVSVSKKSTTTIAMMNY